MTAREADSIIGPSIADVANRNFPTDAEGNSIMAKLAPEQLFQIEDLEAFKAYVAASWLNVGQDERGWYCTGGSAWTMATMRQEGWNVELTGERQLQANDSIRYYFSITF